MPATIGAKYATRPVPQGATVEQLAVFLGVEFQNIQRAFPSPMVRSTTIATTQLVTDRVLFADPTAGAFAVTLLSPISAPPWPFTIKNTTAGANLVTITGTVDGVVNPTIATLVWKTVQSDGVQWWTIG